MYRNKERTGFRDRIWRMDPEKKHEGEEPCRHKRAMRTRTWTFRKALAAAPGRRMHLLLPRGPSGPILPPSPGRSCQPPTHGPPDPSRLRTAHSRFLASPIELPAACPTGTPGTRSSPPLRLRPCRAFPGRPSRPRPCGRHRAPRHRCRHPEEGYTRPGYATVEEAAPTTPPWSDVRRPAPGSNPIRPRPSTATSVPRSVYSPLFYTLQTPHGTRHPPQPLRWQRRRAFWAVAAGTHAGGLNRWPGIEVPERRRRVRLCRPGRGAVSGGSKAMSGIWDPD